MPSDVSSIQRRTAVAPLCALALVAVAVAAFWGWRGRPQQAADVPPGRLPCVSYAPYHDGQSALDKNFTVGAAQIEKDLRLLAARFDCVRTYSGGQGVAETVEIADRLGLKVLMGAWIGRDAKNNAEEIATAIGLAKRYPGTVRAIVVGNEVLLRGDVPPATLIAAIGDVRRSIDVPVTYADVWEFWLKYPEVADAVDFVTIHILPYWENDPTGSARAVPYSVDVVRKVAAAFPGKKILVGEIGWPSAGRARENAAPGRVNQARFIRGFAAAARENGIDYNLIEAFDQQWKRLFEGKVGGHWGIFDSAGREKFPFAGPVREEPRWRAFAAASGGIAALVFLSFWRRRAVGFLAAFAIASYAAIAVTAAIFQARHIAEQARNPYEWGVGGVQLALATIAPLAVLHLWVKLADAGRGGALFLPPWPASFARICAWLRRPKLASCDGALGQGFLLLATTISVSVTTLALIFDPRYRDFPVCGVLAPVLGFAMLIWFGAYSTARQPGERHEEAWFAALLVAGAAVLIVKEKPWNLDALAWTGVALLLARTLAALRKPAA